MNGFRDDDDIELSELITKILYMGHDSVHISIRTVTYSTPPWLQVFIHFSITPIQTKTKLKGIKKVDSSTHCTVPYCVFWAMLSL